MNSFAVASLPPGCLWAQAHAARKFQRAPPEVFGFGVITAIPGLMRSPQSLMPFGFPLRTRNTIVEVYGVLFCGSSVAQLIGSSFP